LSPCYQYTIFATYEFLNIHSNSVLPYVLMHIYLITYLNSHNSQIDLYLTAIFFSSLPSRFLIRGEIEKNKALKCIHVCNCMSALEREMNRPSILPPKMPFVEHESNQNLETH
jgi:hypothetical protein